MNRDATPEASPLEAPSLEVWRGFVNAWDCDELGHMNMRFYFGRAAEGLAALAAAMGAPRAFTADATATLRIAAQHLRYLDEARAGDSLYMTGGLYGFGEHDAQVIQVLRHAGDHRPCAAIATHVVHATPTGRVFPWAARTQAAMVELKAEVPDFAAPRGLPPGPPADPAGAWADNLACVALGPATPVECDVFGEMTVQAAMGRTSDGSGLLYEPVRRAIVREEPGLRLGIAVLEHRTQWFARPRAGEQVQVRSRITALEGKTLRLEHWLCDPVDRRVWAHVQAVSVHFDLDRRRAVAIPPPVLAELKGAMALDA
jgi:acyl-CoA thioester hydrolase